MATHLYDLLEFFAGPIRRVVAAVGSLVQQYKSEDSSTTLVEDEYPKQAGMHAQRGIDIIPEPQIVSDTGSGGELQDVAQTSSAISSRSAARPPLCGTTCSCATSAAKTWPAFPAT